MEKKKKILITGISGLLGNNLAFCLRDGYEILGLYHSCVFQMAGVKSEKAGLDDPDILNRLIKDFSPDLLIHCAAVSDVDLCEKNPETAHLVNVSGTRNIVKALNGLKTKLIYISSDLVYGHKEGSPLTEEDLIDPPNVYGRTKYEGEREALKHGDALIFRTNFYGWNYQNKYSLAEWIIHELEYNKEIKGFKDVTFSSVYTFDLAVCLIKAAGNNLSGVYNLGSSTYMTKYEFACALAELFKLDKSLIKDASVDDVHLTAERRKLLPLDVGKIQKDLGVVLPSMFESLRRFYDDYNSGVSKELKNEEFPRMSFIPYGRQSLDNNDIQAVVDVLKSSHLTQGSKIKDFEDALAGLTGSKGVVAVNSGTSALHLACLAAGVESGDEVITSPISFVASSNCVAYCGGRPVFADIDPDTYNILPEEVDKKINERTKAVIPVHFAGQSCAMKEIREVVSKKEKQYGNKIFIIEDASHALGSKYLGTEVGSCAFSDMATMSFHPVKHITTGEGGAVLTNGQSLYRKIKFFSSHGITSEISRFAGDKEVYTDEDGDKKPWYYEQQFLGYNYRITDIQCSLGLSQLKKLPFFIKRRREIVGYYNDRFTGIPVVKIPYQDPDCASNFHLYVLLFDFITMGVSRGQFIRRLREEGIKTQVHYIPIYFQPYYKKTFNTDEVVCPNAEYYYERALSIPLYPGMTIKDVNKVVDAVKEITGCGKN